jgi:anti-sigma factor RsiW
MKPMDCNEARTHLLDRRRGTLAIELRAPLELHLAGCAACRNEDAADQELSLALEERLPRRQAPRSLKHELAARWSDPPRRKKLPAVLRTAAVAALGGAMTLLVLAGWRARRPDESMVREAVSDHLRVLYSQRPLEVESSDRHQEKPWFSGRLDFAPVMAFNGDDEFALQGGGVGYFIDRKAATFVFKRRLHVITLFVFPSRGLGWPALGTQAIGEGRGSLATLRGFHVLLWRTGDLGYALVSDIDEAELLTLGAKISGG